MLHNSNRHGGMVLHVYRTQLDGGGPPERIFSGSYHQQPKALTGDGVLIYQESSNPITGLDVLQADLTRGAGPISLVQTEHNEAHASLSPDESLLAYASDRTGQAAMKSLYGPIPLWKDVSRFRQVVGLSRPGRRIPRRCITGR